MKNNMKWRLVAAPLAMMLLGIPAVACEEIAGAADTLCCKDFKVGADLSAVDWDIEGEGAATFGAFMQATADFAGTATAAVSDVGSACQAIAVDLGADPRGVKQTDQAARTTAWCDLAVAQITAVLGGNITVVAQPPSCSFNASVQANCEAKCTVEASCEAELGNIELRCEPGEISGKCRAECTGTCEGSANLAVKCDGVCKGTCEGDCNGACSNMGPGGTCRGSCDATCKGECRGSCEVDAKAKVECSGDCTGGCSVAVVAPKCKGELKPPSAKCQGSAECSGSCRASSNAKAECTEPSVEVRFSGAASIDTDLAIASLRLNLPKIVAAARGKVTLLAANAEELVTVTGSFATNAKDLSVKAGLCAIPAGEALAQAGTNLKATVTASSKVLGAVKIAP
ncbi:MAG: hypothetical protein ACMG6S_02580 [Byssovorax sp.]